MIVTNPGKKPAALRLDQLERYQPNENQTLSDSDTTIQPSSSGNTKPIELKPSRCSSTQFVRSRAPLLGSRYSKENLKPRLEILFPMIVHIGICKPQTSYIDNPE